MGFLRSKSQIPIWESENNEDLPKALAYVAKIKNQKKLYTIAKNAAFIEVILAAVEKLNKPELVVDLIDERSSYFITREIANRLINKDVIFEVAKTSTNYWAAIVSVEKIDDQSLLVDIVNDGVNTIARIKAIDKLKDPYKVDEDIIENIYTDFFSFLNSYTAKNIINNMKLGNFSQIKLAEFLKEHKLDNPDMSIQSINMINNQEILAEIATDSENSYKCVHTEYYTDTNGNENRNEIVYDLRIFAVDKLTDKKLLEKIIDCGSENIVRIAKRRLEWLNSGSDMSYKRWIFKEYGK